MATISLSGFITASYVKKIFLERIVMFYYTYSRSRKYIMYIMYIYIYEIFEHFINLFY